MVEQRGLGLGSRLGYQGRELGKWPIQKEKMASDSRQPGWCFFYHFQPAGAADSGGGKSRLEFFTPTVTLQKVGSPWSESSASFRDFSNSPIFRKHLERATRQFLSPF